MENKNAILLSSLQSLFQGNMQHVNNIGITWCTYWIIVSTTVLMSEMVAYKCFNILWYSSVHFTDD